MALRAAFAAGLATWLSACVGAEGGAAAAPSGQELTLAPPPVAPEVVFAPPSAAAPASPSPLEASAPAAWQVLPAAEQDDAHADSQPVEVRRLVYRVTLAVPPGLGSHPQNVSPPAAELQVDLSEQRLRARFVGQGWPVDAGSEVRLRGDRPGVYLFDGLGGRPLPPGGLAAWFQGGELGEFEPVVGVRPPADVEAAGPGDPFCMLLAEWSGQAREALDRRCEGGPPVRFRLGPFRAERTADVPAEMPRASLRADHLGPPPRSAHLASRAFFEPSVLGRLRARPHAGAAPTPVAGRPFDGLEVENASGARVIVVVSGLAVGSVDAGETAYLAGLVPGQHVVSALRPLGVPVVRARAVDLPGTLTIRR